MRNWFHKIYNAVKPKSENERMQDYLAQATDAAHLEYLMDRWDRKMTRGFR